MEQATATALQAADLSGGSYEAAIDLFHHIGGTSDSFVNVFGKLADFKSGEANGFEGGGEFAVEGIE
jgi:hypothetical protein